MATFTVSNTSNSGGGSLRQAIALAAETAGDDVIVFDASVFVPGSGAMITLASRLDIASGNNVTINGDTNGDGDIDVTISGGGATHMLDVASGASVTLKALEFRSGREDIGNGSVPKAGAIVNAGVLTIEASAFVDNGVVAIGFDADSAGSSAAGAILNMNSGVLAVRETAFSNNVATGQNGGTIGGDGLAGGHAGTIVNLGILNLAQVAFVDNSATGGDGANGFPFTLGTTGGDGGSAAGAVLNLGTSAGSFEPGNSTVQGGVGGLGNPAGSLNGDNGGSSTGVLSVGSGSSTATGDDNLGTMGTDVETISSGPFHGLGGGDILTADGAGVSLFGGAGEDTLISSFFGTTTLNGGLGNDNYEVFNANTVIQEGVGEGLETVRAAVSYVLADDDDIEELRTNFTGGTSAINLTGNGRQQDITGNNGNNILNGGVDNVEDVLFGLLGNDTYVLGGSLLDTIEDTGGTDTILSTITRDLNVHADIENLSLKGTGNINATGNALANKINGNIGKNDLIGNIGNDTLNGGDGNDRLKGGAGFDVMNGGKGVDLATFSDQTTRVIVSLKETGTTTAFIKGVAADSLTAIENLNGGSGNDVFKGNSLANTFNGNAGNDNLNGGLGNDILTGGIGADTFRFTNVNFGRDRITDFSDNLDKLSFGTGVADSFRDFRITGNGSKSVLVTLGDDTITVQSTKVITLTASDFLFE